MTSELLLPVALEVLPSEVRQVADNYNHLMEQPTIFWLRSASIFSWRRPSCSFPWRSARPTACCAERVQQQLCWRA